MEFELLQTKQDFCEALNVAFERGGNELLDIIEKNVSFREYKPKISEFRWGTYYSWIIQSNIFPWDFFLKTTTADLKAKLVIFHNKFLHKDASFFLRANYCIFKKSIFVEMLSCK